MAVNWASMLSSSCLVRHLTRKWTVDCLSQICLNSPSQQVRPPGFCRRWPDGLELFSRIISGIRTLLWTTSSACWKRFCSGRTSSISALDVSRPCALQIYILITYLLVLLRGRFAQGSNLPLLTPKHSSMGRISLLFCMGVNGKRPLWLMFFSNIDSGAAVRIKCDLNANQFSLQEYQILCELRSDLVLCWPLKWFLSPI